MNCLITAGNTMTPIDEVRGITNIFSGRTGARIASEAASRGHRATLLTSRPEVVGPLDGEAADRLRVVPYRTFDDLRRLMEGDITRGDLDAVVHCAAVSDFACEGIYAPSDGTRFDPTSGHWEGSPSDGPSLVDRRARKVKSEATELWLRLVPTPKLVDQVRRAWGFRGVLVKFKLEVGLSDESLVEVAERSRRQSEADLMVGNTLEGMASWAWLGPLDGRYERIPRDDLPTRLIEAVEGLHAAGPSA
jgi:phosphopantothenoylcysteine synthetase/decarboxylase